MCLLLFSLSFPCYLTTVFKSNWNNCNYFQSNRVILSSEGMVFHSVLPNIYLSLSVSSPYLTPYYSIHSKISLLVSKIPKPLGYKGSIVSLHYTIVLRLSHGHFQLNNLTPLVKPFSQTIGNYSRWVQRMYLVFLCYTTIRKLGHCRFIFTHLKLYNHTMKTVPIQCHTTVCGSVLYSGLTSVISKWVTTLNIIIIIIIIVYDSFRSYYVSVVSLKRMHV